MNIIYYKEMRMTETGQFFFFNLSCYIALRIQAAVLIAPFQEDGDRILICNARTLSHNKHNSTKLF